MTIRWPLFVGRVHKWLALFIGIQLVIWTVTGMYMVAVHIDYIHGDHLVRAAAAPPQRLAGLVAPAQVVADHPDASEVKLQTLLGRPVWRVESAAGAFAVDARSGDRLAPLKAAQARQAALGIYTGKPEIVSVGLLTGAPLEMQTRKPPYWRVEFAGWNQPTLYISPSTGELISRRHNLWRVFDFAWMLHIMEYEQRSNVNNLLLRFATWSAVLMSLSGAWLLWWSIGRKGKEGGSLKQGRVATRRPIVSPWLWRTIHKWVGLVLGLQFVLWTISGAVMALLDMDEVGGHSAPAPAQASAAWPADLLSPAWLGAVEGFTMRRLADRPVYEVVSGGQTRLLDAQSGEPVTVGPAVAAEVSRQAFHHDAQIVSVERLGKANLEAREHAGPMWRVNFADDENSSSYVSAVTGRPLVNRGDTWRVWDFVWMLHNMDYVNRTSFNHPLIIFVAFGALWMSFTGFYLLFKSFRRRDFNWVLGRTKRQA